MASTIKLKNGSGAPTTGDLVQGEPALDLTNKRLYTENASGVVIEVGVNPTSITTGNITANGTINLTGATVSNAGSITTADINGGTIDGTVIGGSSAAAVTGTTITGTSFVSSGDMTFGDSDKAIFGAGSDLQIYHDGSNSIIADAGSGNLQIRANDFQLLNAANTQNIIRGYDATGAVSLHYGGAEKLATSSTGVYVTGTVTADGLSLDNAQYINFKNSSNVSTRSLGINVANTFYIGGIDADIGDILFVDGGATRASFANGGDISFYEDTGTTAKLFWDASEERLGIGTTSPSVHLDVEGTAQVNLLDVTHDGDRAVNFVKTGANTFSIEHDVNQFYFWNQTTSESPLLFQNDGDVIMNGGNVGIGTSSPSRKVSLADSVNGYNLELQQTSAYNSGNQSGIVFSAPYNIGGSVTDLASIRGGKENATDEDFGGKLAFYTRANGGSDTERMRIDSSGNVGIGTSSVSQRLDVQTSTVNTGMLVYNTNTASGASVPLFLASESDGSTTNVSFENNGAGNMVFRTGATTKAGYGTERARISAAGNVGIGTDSPSDKLTIKAASSHLRLQGTSNTNKNVSINYNESGDYGQINCDESGVNQKDLWMTGLNLKFGRSTGSESMRIDDLGNLLVGRSSAGAAATDDGHVFYGSGQHYIFSNATECVRFYETSGSGQQVGSISITSSATAFNTSSDERLKENITDAPAGNVDDIKVRSFDWKADGSHQDYGMVAQELEAVAPYAVTKGETEDDMWSVDYSKLVPMLIKEIQDLKAEVAALKGAN
jgi:hypothetical protein